PALANGDSGAATGSLPYRAPLRAQPERVSDGKKTLPKSRATARRKHRNGSRRASSTTAAPRRDGARRAQVRRSKIKLLIREEEPSRQERWQLEQRSCRDTLGHRSERRVGARPPKTGGRRRRSKARPAGDQGGGTGEEDPRGSGGEPNRPASGCD